MRRLIAIIAIVRIISSFSFANSVSFRVIGPFNPYAISDDGTVVAGDNVRWTEADGITDLGTLLDGETSSFAWDISADGSVIVGRCNNANSQAAYRWTKETGKVLLGMDRDASAVSADGSIIVGGGPVYWDESNIMHTLPMPDNFGMAFDISPVNKDIVGYATIPPDYSNPRTVLWTQSSNYEDMIDLGGGGWWHYGAISADGHVIVGYIQDTGAEAFRWTQETGTVRLGFLPGKNYSVAWDVSSDGSIIVGSSSQDSEAFIWDINSGMRSLKDILKNNYGIDLNGWTLSSATAITPDGRAIVGGGTDPNGNNQGWIINMNEHEPVILTMQVEPNNFGINTVIPGIGQHTYFSFLPVVSLKADAFIKCPNVYRFSHWIGDVNDLNSSTTTITLNQNKTVTAVYYVDQKKCGDEFHPILKGDLNGDCRINFDDFAIYCQQWLSCTHPDCD